MRIRKLAAIDIGSNAIRLLVQNVIEAPGKPVQFNKSALIRVPVRLGEDSFLRGCISEANAGRIRDTLQAFALLMQVGGVERYRACATSAIREAGNGEAVLEAAARDTGIRVERIDGQEEATIIASAGLGHLLEQDTALLYVDVGGGSTEYTLFTEGRVRASRSFRIGTVRQLGGKVPEGEWEALERWLRLETGALPGIRIVGSGGNINKLYKLSQRRGGRPLSYSWLVRYERFLRGMSYEARVAELGLNPDRADVILPAARIYLRSCSWSGARWIHVPQIGLSDGLIRDLYQREFAGK